MSELREYEVVVNGERTTMNLSDDDAKRLDGKLVARLAARPARVPLKPRPAKPAPGTRHQ